MLLVRSNQELFTFEPSPFLVGVFWRKIRLPNAQACRCFYETAFLADIFQF